MNISGNTLLILAVILFFGLIVPQFFRKIELPFVTSLIILGSVLGPNGLNYIQPDETMTIFGLLGASFHMLLAGFEAQALHIKDTGKKLWIFTSFSIIIPFITGTAIVGYYGYSPNAAFFMGIVFISSSIVMVFSNIKSQKMSQHTAGKILRSSVVVQDLVSSLLVFVIFKHIEPHKRFPLPILLGLLISSVIILRMFLPEVVSYFFDRFKKKKTGNEARLRLIIALLLFVMVIYSTLDVHPIIAAFLVGFTLSGIPESIQIKRKLNTIGYAMFIPIYLFIIGVNIDLKLFSHLNTGDYLLLSIIAGAFLSKYLSGYIGCRLSGIKGKEAVLTGLSSTTKLTITISSAYVALTMHLIDDLLYTSIILTSAISIILYPILSSVVTKKWQTSNG